MNLNFDRRKLFYEKWDKQNYERHIKRLQSLMQKNNWFRSRKVKDQKIIQKLITTSHKSHKLSGEYRVSENQKNIKQEQFRLNNYLRSLELPKIMSNNKKSKKDFRIHKVSSLDLKKYLENSILYQKIQNANSYYKKKQFDQTYNQISSIKENIKRKIKNTNDSIKFQTIYKQSNLLKTNFPQYTYTQLQNYLKKNKIISKFHQIYLKFQRLPFFPNQEQIHYSIQPDIIQTGKPNLISHNQLLKDMFLLKIPYNKINFDQAFRIHILRYKTNDGIPIGHFNILPGQNKVTQFYLGKQKMGQFLCFTSWRRVIRQKKHYSEKQNEKSPNQAEYEYSENQYNQDIKNDFENLKRKVSIEASLEQSDSRSDLNILDGIYKQSEQDAIGDYLFRDA